MLKEAEIRSMIGNGWNMEKEAIFGTLSKGFGQLGGIGKNLGQMYGRARDVGGLGRMGAATKSVKDVGMQMFNRGGGTLTGTAKQFAPAAAAAGTVGAAGYGGYKGMQSAFGQKEQPKPWYGNLMSRFGM